MAVKIKLKRLGKIRAPYYRIVIADSRTKRDGRAIEEIGKYHPKAEPSFIEVNSERAQHWLSVGAQPTDPVRKILEITGDWQKFKGLPGAEGTLRTAEPKPDRKVAFAAAAAESLADSGAKARPKGKAGTDAKAGGAKADAGKADAGKADAAKADAAKADAGKADKADKAEKTPAKAPKAAETVPAAADAASTDAATTEAATTEAGATTADAAAAQADAAATAEAKAEAIAEVAADSATDDGAADDGATDNSAAGNGAGDADGSGA